MDRGDEMRNGAAPSAVRVLPAEGVRPIVDTQSPSPTDPKRRGWFLPLGISAAALLAFVAATRPAVDTDQAGAITTAPPLLSAVTAETIDLTTPALVPATTTDWEDVDFKWTGQIAGTLLYNGSLVAYGWDDEGAKAWLSGTGAGWREVTRLDVPESAKSSIEHAVVWDRDIVALGAVDDGVGLWTARALAAWTYQGIVPEMTGRQITGLVAGPQLLALAEDITVGSVGSIGWVSSDGLTWTPLGPLDTLDGLQIHTLAAADGWFYAGGTKEYEGTPGRAVIYRSQDGLLWEPTDGVMPGLLSPDWGGVVDITTTSKGLLAVGWMFDGEIAVWQSVSGDKWTRLAEDEPLFQPAHVMVQLHDFDMRSDPFAEIGIDGEIHRLAPASQVRTDAGTMTVDHVGPTTVGLTWEDGSKVDAEPGEGGMQTLSAYATSVTSQGSRMVITGAIGVTRNSVPAIWYSADNGHSWTRTIADPWDEGELLSGLIRGNNIVATGSGPHAAPLVWHSTWDNSAAEAVGVQSVHAFVHALNNRDVDAVVASVPTWRGGAADPVIELPTLGKANSHWWDESGLIDVNTVADTVAYLDQLHTSIAIDDCTSRLQLGETDTLRVACGFTAVSDLLALMSSQDAVGRIDVAIEQGAFQRVTLSASSSQTMWQFLASGTAGAPEEDRSTLVRADESGRVKFDPTFDAQSAAVHMRLAAGFTAGLLRPGETKVVETSFGTMEWQWYDGLPVPVYTFDWITATESGYIALGHGEPGRWTDNFSLWSSADGIDWEAMPAPPDVQSMWGLQSYRDGLLARAWTDERSQLVVFDGEAWSEITFPTEYPNGYIEVMNLATSGDTILAFTGSWTEESHGLVASNAWLIGPDRIPRKTTLPPHILPSEETLGLAGSEEGFVLATSEYGTPHNMSVWHSPNGQDWSLIAETASIEDAAYVWNFQHHFTEYFVVGEGAETSCSASGDGVACQNLVGLWSSPDGVAWDRVLTTAGEPVATYEIGSGQLGLAAIAAESYENKLPRPIYLSPDGRTWDRAGNLALLYPDANWWWVNQPAVGESSILISGAAYYETGGDDGDVPFIIVGRLVDR